MKINLGLDILQKVLEDNKTVSTEYYFVPQNITSNMLSLYIYKSYEK